MIKKNFFAQTFPQSLKFKEILLTGKKTCQPVELKSTIFISDNNTRGLDQMSVLRRREYCTCIVLPRS